MPSINGWIVSILMAVGIVLMAFGWHGTYSTLEIEKANHARFVQDVAVAQAEADRKAEAKRKELEQRAINDAKEADLRYGKLLGEYRANLLRLKASQGSSGGPSSSEYQAPASGPGPSTGTQFSTIVITMKDAEICAINTARLQAVYEWAHSVK